MSIADAINYLTDGKAAKRTSWGGYVAKTVTSAIDAQVETFALTFKNRAGTEYVYTWNGTEWIAPATKVPFDEEFIAGILADDWITGKTTDFEAARSSSGTW